MRAAAIALLPAIREPAPCGASALRTRYRGIMFVPPESLPFNMAELIERSISEWYGAQPPGTPSPEVESVGDFIVAELNRRKLRYFDGLVAHFEDDADPEAYRECVWFALGLWRIAVS